MSNPRKIRLKQINDRLAEEKRGYVKQRSFGWHWFREGEQPQKIGRTLDECKSVLWPEEKAGIKGDLI